MITNIRKNIMGTLSFDGKFPGMRKEQDFIVYPIQADEAPVQIKIQSDKRSGFVSLVSGAVTLYPGKYFMGAIVQVGALTAEELFDLKANIMATASGKAGTNGVVYVDNSGAIDVFGVAA
jgi:hypothetical protein